MFPFHIGSRNIPRAYGDPRWFHFEHQTRDYWHRCSPIGVACHTSISTSGVALSPELDPSLGRFDCWPPAGYYLVVESRSIPHSLPEGLPLAVVPYQGALYPPISQEPPCPALLQHQTQPVWECAGCGARFYSPASVLNVARGGVPSYWLPWPLGLSLSFSSDTFFCCTISSSLAVMPPRPGRITFRISGTLHLQSGRLEVWRRLTRWPLYVLGYLCLSRSMALPRWARGCAAIAYAFSGPLPTPPQQGVVLPPDRRYRAPYPDLLAERSSLPRFAPERGLEDLSLTFPSFLVAKIRPGIEQNGWRLSCLILIPWHFIVSLSVGDICACPDQRRFLARPEVVPRSLTLFLDLSRLHQRGCATS